MIRATQHPNNVDLRVCTTYALGDLQSPSAILALIHVYKRNVASTTALEALGKIADPSALGFLQTVTARPRNELESRQAKEAIKQIQIVQRPDAFQELIRRVRAAMANGQVDGWAVRNLALRRHQGAVAAITEALDQVAEGDLRGRVVLAAALLAHGKAGIAALHQLAHPGQSGKPASAIARGNSSGAVRRGETSRSSHSIRYHHALMTVISPSVNMM